MRQIIEKNHHKSLSVLEDILERPTEGCEGNNLPTESDADQQSFPPLSD
jgi:hypothetical protein